MEKTMEKNPFETLESVKTKTGRFTIVQDQVRVNGHRQPYDYLEIREGVSILPIREGKTGKESVSCLFGKAKFCCRDSIAIRSVPGSGSFRAALSIREGRRKKRQYGNWEKRQDIQ